MRNICVRDSPCWDQNSERVFTSSAKLQLTLPVRGLKRRVRIQNVALKIHFPVPKYLCEQGIKMSSTVLKRKFQQNTKSKSCHNHITIWNLLTFWSLLLHFWTISPRFSRTHLLMYPHVTSFQKRYLVLGGVLRINTNENSDYLAWGDVFEPTAQKHPKYLTIITSPGIQRISRQYCEITLGPKHILFPRDVSIMYSAVKWRYNCMKVARPVSDITQLENPENATRRGMGGTNEEGVMIYERRKNLTHRVALDTFENIVFSINGPSFVINI